MWVLQLSDPEQCLALPNSSSPRKESELGPSGDGAGEVTRWKDSAPCHSWAGPVRLPGGPRASAGAAPALSVTEKTENPFRALLMRSLQPREVPKVPHCRGQQPGLLCLLFLTRMLSLPESWQTAAGPGKSPLKLSQLPGTLLLLAALELRRACRDMLC